MKNYQNRPETNSGAAAPSVGGRCPEGYCQYYSQHGACLPIDPDKCNRFPAP